MKHIYLIVDSNDKVIAVYDSETLASRMKQPLEEKFKIDLFVEKRSINQDIKMIGVVK